MPKRLGNAKNLHSLNRIVAVRYCKVKDEVSSWNSVGCPFIYTSFGLTSWNEKDEVSSWNSAGCPFIYTSFGLTSWNVN
jgi:UDP:flavonoid glycosyltransferase YjiC (YdhE family)